jgi:antirestriction protein
MSKHDSYEHYAENSAHKPELEPPAPRIYVASLSDYNAGRLVGRWVTAASDVEKLQDGVRAMLATSPEPGAEEFAIHDYEGFGDYRVDEFESLDTVAALGRGIAEHGLAFTALAAYIGGSYLAEDPRRFAESYLGAWTSPRDFVEQMIDESGWASYLEGLPDCMQPYVHIDYEQLAHDVQLELAVMHHAEGVWVFDPRTW